MEEKTNGIVLGGVSFGENDKILSISKVGASLPITSFGHSLMHAANEAMRGEKGLLGVASGLFDMTATGITSAILFAFLIAVIFKPKSWNIIMK